MNLKRTYTIHLDAVLVITLLFICSLGFNFFQQKQVEDLGWQVYRQEWKLVENDMNLSSQKNYIERLEQKCDQQEMTTADE